MYNSNNDMLYVASGFGNYITVFNAATNALVSAIPLNGPVYVTYSAQGNVVYAVYSDPNTYVTTVAAISGTHIQKRIFLSPDFQWMPASAVLNPTHSMLFVYSADEAETNCPEVIGVNLTSWKVLGNGNSQVLYGETLAPPSYADGRGVVYGDYVLTGGGVRDDCGDLDLGYLPTTTEEYAINTSATFVTSCHDTQGSVLSVPQLKVNFVSQCGTTKTGFDANVYSATTGSLVKQIPGSFVVFGYNIASNIVYAAGANNYIYKIQG